MALESGPDWALEDFGKEDAELGTDEEGSAVVELDSITTTGELPANGQIAEELSYKMVPVFLITKPVFFSWLESILWIETASLLLLLEFWRTTVTVRLAPELFDALPLNLARTSSYGRLGQLDCVQWTFGLSFPVINRLP